MRVWFNPFTGHIPILPNSSKTRHLRPLCHHLEHTQNDALYFRLRHPPAPTDRFPWFDLNNRFAHLAPHWQTHNAASARPIIIASHIEVCQVSGARPVRRPFSLATLRYCVSAKYQSEGEILTSGIVHWKIPKCVASCLYSPTWLRLQIIFTTDWRRSLWTPALSSGLCIAATHSQPILFLV